MTQPYRVAAAVDIPEAVTVPRGLVRSNGSRCRCAPPGWIYCWWFGVLPKDRWYCKHGGGWLRRSSYGTGRLADFWETAPQRGDA